MHMVRKNNEGYWRNDNLPTCFLDAIRSLLHGLRSGSINDIFFPEVSENVKRVVFIFTISCCRSICWSGSRVSRLLMRFQDFWRGNWDLLIKLETFWPSSTRETNLQDFYFSLHMFVDVDVNMPVDTETKLISLILKTCLILHFPTILCFVFMIILWC